MDLSDVILLILTAVIMVLYVRLMLKNKRRSLGSRAAEPPAKAGNDL